MKILLNITPSELKIISGDVTYYLNLLDVPNDLLEFSIVQNTNKVFRFLDKIPSKLNRDFLPGKIKNWLFRYSRYHYISARDLNSIDAILSHITFPWLPRNMTDQIPIIWSSQGISPPGYYEQYHQSFNHIVDMYNDFAPKCDLLLIWTKSCADIMLKHCNFATPVVIIPPITKFYAPENILPKNTQFHLLFVGRDARRKGLYDTLDAFAELSRNNRDITFDIVSSLPEKIIKKLKTNPQINYYSNISEKVKAQLLDRADILILPTYAETYGYVMTEAMAYRCALITSNYEPLNELVVEGENGFLVQPGDVKQIAHKIKLLVENPALIEEFKENNFRKYLNNFSKDAVIPKYFEAFSQIMCRKGGQ